MSQHRVVEIDNTTPTRITPNGKHSGMDITIQNPNAEGYVYVGVDDTLSTSNYGYRVSPNHAISFELNSNDALYLIGSDNLDAAVIQLGLEQAGY